MNWSGGRPPEGVLIDHHQESMSVLDYFRVNAAVREALKPRVDLPSGGYIIIEPTEALPSSTLTLGPLPVQLPHGKPSSGPIARQPQK